ncbi:MAG TPA: ParB/RepB/Spo0J family partition protein [Candidatus Acidoferrales bacterium]|jgi:ParB family chromosome partitioning protein|nr:ParB/RepB/Spo0J family partition protein [Candidatus Acidoferrales bacterium]
MINDKRKALGRGLESLIPGRPISAPQTPAAAPATQTSNEIAVDLIDPNPYQTRRQIREEALNELTESVRTSGVVQPVVLRPSQEGRYQLVAGERRWLASRRAGRTTIPAIVRQISNEQAMEITIIENLQREDLNPMEQARAFERLSREFGMTQEQIASRTGKDRASVANFIRLLKLPAAVQDSLESGALSFGHGKVLVSLVGFPEHLEKAAREILHKQLSVRQTEELVSRLLNPEVTENTVEQKQTAIDPNVREAQRSLERFLGVKVEIQDRKGRGKIILKYSSLEDFDRIVEVLGAR